MLGLGLRDDGANMIGSIERGEKRRPILDEMSNDNYPYPRPLPGRFATQSGEEGRCSPAPGGIERVRQRPPSEVSDQEARSRARVARLTCFSPKGCRGSSTLANGD